MATPSTPFHPRICVDDRALLQSQGTGVATYAQVLRTALLKAGFDPERLTDRAEVAPGAERRGRARLWAASLYVGARPLQRAASQIVGDDGAQACGEAAWFRADVFREAQVHFNLYRRLLRVSCPRPPAIMHWTYPVPITMLGTRNIYTIHDTIPQDEPHLTPISQRRQGRLLDTIVCSADHIVTVSDHSRQRLIRNLGCAPDRITNTYQAADVLGAAEGAPPAGLTPGGYLLFCGTVEPRKNLQRLVAAHRASGVVTPLVIAGPQGWRAGAELAGISPGDRVVRLPWLERPVLLNLMRHARALLFPSLAEGFGLPAVEAMALGTPVLTSNRGSLAEIAGDGALQVDPSDTGALAHAIAALVQDDGLCTTLRLAGSQRAAIFGLDAYAARLKRLYDRVISDGCGAHP